MSFEECLRKRRYRRYYRSAGGFDNGVELMRKRRYRRYYRRCRNRITGVSRIIDRHEGLDASGKQ